MARKLGDTDFSKGEKTIMISLINDYKLFNATDSQMMRLISQKIGRNISSTLFKSLKKESDKKGLAASEWLDTYIGSQIVDHYWKRIKELEFAQRIILERMSEEHGRGEKANRYLINQYARTVGDLATRLCEAGMSPPIMAKIHSMIPKEILTGQVTDPIELEKYLKQFDESIVANTKAIPKLDDKENVEQKENGTNRTSEETNNGDNNEINPLSAETAILPPIDQKNDSGSTGGSQGEIATAQGDQPVF